MSIQEKFDVVVIGGGAAGISAAIWCADLGMTAVILEKEDKLYGQLHSIHGPIRNYPGIVARDGAELIGMLESSVGDWGIRSELMVSIEAVDCDAKTAKLSDGRVFTGRAMFIATGVRRRLLGVPGEAEFEGKGVLRSGADEKDKVKGRRVVVVGGGDAAAENALLLSEYAERVLLVHRRSTLAARSEFQDRIAAAPNIELILDSEISEIGGTDNVEWVNIISRDTGRDTRIETDHFIARIGVAPNSELLSPQLTTDSRGYIIVDHLCRTNADDIFAIGDVASPLSPTVPTAVGMGATAAKSALFLITALKNV